MESETSKPTYEELADAMRLVKRMKDEAVIKMDWARSPLDANAIFLLNEGFLTIDRLCSRLQEGDGS